MGQEEEQYNKVALIMSDTISGDIIFCFLVELDFTLKEQTTDFCWVYFFHSKSKGITQNTLTRSSFADSALELLKSEFLDLPAMRVPPKGMLATMAVSRAAMYF